MISSFEIVDLIEKSNTNLYNQKWSQLLFQKAVQNGGGYDRVQAESIKRITETFQERLILSKEDFNVALTDAYKARKEFIHGTNMFTK